MFTALMFILFLVAATLAGLFIALFISKSKEFKVTFERFKNVIDIDKEIKKVNKELKDRRNKYEKFLVECSKRENEVKRKKMHQEKNRVMLRCLENRRFFTRVKFL